MKHVLCNFGLRKNGIYYSFHIFHEYNGRYPDNPGELLTVTSSVLNDKNFQKYKEWFLEFIGDNDAK